MENEKREKYYRRFHRRHHVNAEIRWEEREGMQRMSMSAEKCTTSTFKDC